MSKAISRTTNTMPIGWPPEFDVKRGKMDKKPLQSCHCNRLKWASDTGFLMFIATSKSACSQAMVEMPHTKNHRNVF